MASGGSLKTKLPSFTSTSWLRAQPPASSVNLSSKMTSLPSQAEAWGKPARQSIAAVSKTGHFAISGSLAGLTRQRANPYRVGLGSATVAGSGGRFAYANLRLFGGSTTTIYESNANL